MDHSDEARRHYDNLILFCYAHHVETDEVALYPVSRGDLKKGAITYVKGPDRYQAGHDPKLPVANDWFRFFARGLLVIVRPRAGNATKSAHLPPPYTSSGRLSVDVAAYPQVDHADANRTWPTAKPENVRPSSPWKRRRRQSE